MTTMRRLRLGLVTSAFSISLALVFVACGGGGRDEGGGGSVDGTGNSGNGSGTGATTGSGSSSSGTGGLNLNEGGSNNTCTTDCPAPANCGDGSLTPDEACDDGNKDDGDGCSANCLVLEPGYTCPTPGEECKAYARCGDGLFSPPEQCDDGNNVSGDGCSKTCHVEVGFKCTEDSPSTCSATVCGDGKIEGAEGCDVSGNKVPFDGCSAQCLKEPDCSADSCISACGDGMVINEDCDDGNNIDGDGCSADCKVEAGFQCSAAPCEQVDGACVLRVPVVYRDFNGVNVGGHADFEKGGCDAVVPGMVESDLVYDATAKHDIPKFKAADGTGCVTSATTFADWYKPTNKSKSVIDTIVLFDNGSGGFVNRYGNNGDGRTATKWGGTNDGNPLFFPIDNKPGTLTPTANYGAAAASTYNNIYVAGTVPNPNSHNFHFTSEVHFWFQYDSPINLASAAKLDFVGDDDVWVFINGKLAVDLGGLHQPATGGVTLTAVKAAELGLEDGKVYDIAVFHAERKMNGSSFKLTLSGFNAGRSECVADCGDGIVGLGEECDEGPGGNKGGYGKCQADCSLGEYCGDGVKQAGESCDDGNRINDDDCNNACRYLVVK